MFIVHILKDTYRMETKYLYKISEAERESQFVENREDIFNGPTNEIDIELDVEEKFQNYI